MLRNEFDILNTEEIDYVGRELDYWNLPTIPISPSI